LIKLSQDFLKNRDFSSARLLLRRVADAGSAAAALSLGETFDPLIIQRLGAIGVQPDAAKAREWYERAAQLGSDVASQHLAKLAERLPVGVTDDEARVGLVDPGRREAAGGHRGLAILPMLVGASRDQRTSMARTRWRGR
jgi:TPR repeat protein